MFMQPKLLQCEICGKEIKKTLKVKIGSSLLQVCEACSKFGEVQKAKPGAKVKSITGAPGTREKYAAYRRGKPAVKIKTKPEEKELILVENYGRIIKNAREKLNLSQEKLAKMLNEKESVISRIEAQHMKPSEKLARKLEKVLNIKILEEI